MNLVTRLNTTCFSLRRQLLRLACAGLIPMASGQPVGIQLPAPAHGSAAIAALEAHLPDVAKAYGLQPQELVTLFQTQPSLGVDIGGALLFACDGLAAAAHGKLVEGSATSGKPDAAGAPADAMTPNSSVTTLANGTPVDAFKLHSLPGVTRVIYLDFTGHTTSGTSWNTSYAGGNAIVSAPFSFDGDSSTFNDSERGFIQRIWQRVAEDYAPFGVDVTTEDPGVEGLRKTTTSDTAYGKRVVISPTNWYKSTAGGVAYIGSFSYNTDTPCFAFTEQLANGEKYIAEAVAHEVGHTLGLYHDGVTGVTEYYQGHADWAPIMGVGYYRNIVQFSKGEYDSPSNTQDDIAVITSYVPLAGDDHGNTTATATTISGPSVATGGTIESRTDTDVFRIDAGAGDISLTISGPAPDTNVDLKAELLNANGQVLQTSDSVTEMKASIAANVPAGTYYLRVSSVGNGSGSTGYTSYGSIGNYLIMGSFATSGVKQAPVAVAGVSAMSGTAPLTVTFSGMNSTDSDGSIVSYAWNLGNGTTATGSAASATYTAAGTFSAVLTVVDNDGLAGTATVTINVTAGANLMPIASASASVTTGTAPVPVNFSSAGSADPDGSIASYRWDFGDGTSSTVASPSKTYMSPGNYTARLTVTDDRGATAAATVGVSVLGNADLNADIYQFTLTSATAKSGTSGTATIVVLDSKSQPVANVTVSVQWSGVVTTSAIGKTDSRGRITLTSQKTKKVGTLTATIMNVTPPSGTVYDTGIFGEVLTRSVTVQ
jgi:PKD repeat protein